MLLMDQVLTFPVEGCKPLLLKPISLQLLTMSSTHTQNINPSSFNMLVFLGAIMPMLLVILTYERGGKVDVTSTIMAINTSRESNTTFKGDQTLNYDL